MVTKRSLEKLERLKLMLDRGRAESGTPSDLPFEQAQKWILHFNVEHVHGPEEVAYDTDELVVVCLVRDGRAYVRSFVEHHLSLGVKHLFFLDNGSTDGTVEALKTYDNVTVLRTTLPYQRYEMPIKQYLMERFGRGRWSLFVDIDELFDYPYSDVVGLDSLLRYLNERSYTAVVTQMLEMFPQEHLSDAASEDDEPLKERYRFYDISNVRKWEYVTNLTGMRDHWAYRRGFHDISRSHAQDHRLVTNNVRRDHWVWRMICGTGNVLPEGEIEVYTDGIQNTVFGNNPPLTKHSLVFIDEQIKPSAFSPHDISEARIANITCVLFHYKFLKNHLYKYVRQVVREDWFWHGYASKYKEWMRVLEKNPELLVKGEGARELRSVNELVENLFLVVSEEYMTLVYEEEEKRKGAGRAARGGPRGPETEAPYRRRAEAEVQRLRVRRFKQQVEELRKQNTRQDENYRKQEENLRREKDLRKEKQRRVKELLSALAKERSIARSLQKKNQNLQKKNQNLQKKNQNLTGTLRSIRASRSWKLLNKLSRVRTRILRGRKR